jgi:carbon storage regulator CsrA
MNNAELQMPNWLIANSGKLGNAGNIPKVVIRKEESEMLVLTRKIGERIRIGDDITLVVTKMAGNRVTLGIEAPKDVRIVRGELEQFIDAFRDSEEESHDAVERDAAMPVTFGFGSAEACTYVPSQAR